ncbi:MULTISPECIES: carbohydrate porin [Gammaproteobacteria]|uniref:carbohydrate porin n=1 Tax=Gammaproteobacteria TaxID=1236 RepID=UPI0015A7B882|nr:carbohydrate porin [Pseudomonas sp. Hp2]
MKIAPMRSLQKSVILSALLGTGVADAQEAADSSFWNRSTLTGDWGGLRHRLAEDGVTFTGSEVVDSVHNFNGGTREAGRAAGQFLLGVTIDTDKAWGHPGGKLQVTLTNRHGNNLSNDANLGLLQPLQSIYGRGEIWRLSDFWYEQSFNDGATALKFGRVTHGEDYGATPCGNISNVVLCGPASSQIVSGYLYNLPVSSWGVRLRQRLAPTLHVNLGVIESNPVNLSEDRGFYLGTGGATGTIYAAELQWTPTFGSRHDLPGTYKVGGWYDTSNSNNIVYDVNGEYQAVSGGEFARENHHAGFHANVVQQLLAPRADGSHGLTVVGNLAVTDRATNRLHSKAALIFSFTGPLPGRPKDDVTLGIGQVSVNNRVSRSQRAQNEAGLRQASPQDHEQAAELNYGYKLTPAATLRPGFQYVRHPGGLGDRDDILVASLKLVFAL